MNLGTILRSTRRRRRRRPRSNANGNANANAATTSPHNAVRVPPVLRVSLSPLVISMLLFLLAANPTTTVTVTTPRTRMDPAMGFVVLVASYTLRPLSRPTLPTRSRRSGVMQQQQWRKHPRRMPLFAAPTILVPSHAERACEDGTDIPLDTAAAAPNPTEQRIARILDFVDKEVLASSPLSSSFIVDRDSVLERIRSQHEADFRTAEASCLEIEDRGSSRDTRSARCLFERIGCDGQPLRTDESSCGSHNGSGRTVGAKTTTTTTSTTTTNTNTNEYLSSLSAHNPVSPQPSSDDSSVVTSKQLAIRSTEPVLAESAVESIRTAAQTIWSSPASEGEGEGGASRFTYQYTGNSEAHVFDFATRQGDSDIDIDSNHHNHNNNHNHNDSSAGTRAVAALNEALQTKLYPMIREAFFADKNDENDTTTTTQLFVYDALVIRYNATAAREAAEAAAAAATAQGGAGGAGETNNSSPSPSAGQPLHRDLGLVSVNIMLTPASEFEGGGTFFEDQLIANSDSDSNSNQNQIMIPEPLKPLGVGHCLAHPASYRHAGAGTTSGVREILVIFVSAAQQVVRRRRSEDENVLSAPPELRSLRLKECRSFCHSECSCCGGVTQQQQQQQQQQRSILLCRILHQRLAVRSNSNDLPGDRALLRSDHGCDCDCDGEAVQYLGTALMEYADHLVVSSSSAEAEAEAESSGEQQQQPSSSSSSSARATREAALECFRLASILTPCDSRVYNNLGIVLGKIRNSSATAAAAAAAAVESADIITSPLPLLEAEEEEERAYRTGWILLRRAMEAGCTTTQTDRHLVTLSLNYGLFVANRDRFEDAVAILEPAVAVAAVSSSVSVSSNNNNTNANANGLAPSATTAEDYAHFATCQDAVRLWEYCKARLLHTVENR